MKRIIALVSVLLILGAGALFANGSSQQGAAAGGGAATEKVVMWTSHTAHDLEVLRDIVAGYNATNPAVPVEIVSVPGSETEITKLATSIRGGTAPDVYFLDRFTIAERAAAGMLEDITPAINKLDPNLKSKYLDFAWQETQFKGKTYGLPLDTDVRAIFYRKDLLRAAGIDPAILDPAKGPVTVQTLWDISKKLVKTDAQGNLTQVGLVPFATELQGWHYIWGFVYNGQFANIPAGKVTPLDKGVVDAYQMLYDWSKDLGPQKIRTFLSTYTPPNNPPQNNPFITGQVAIMVNGDWMISQFREYAPNLEYGITYLPIPKAGDKPTSFAGGWSLVVPTGSKRTEAAVKFMIWACGADGQRIYTKGTTHLPTYASLLNEDIFTTEHQFFKAILPIARSRPVLPVGAFYWDQLTAAQQAVVDNTSTPQQALQVVETQTQAQLNKFLPLQ
ncbi:ABC transporter substrate-binding protein [Leadbettera azotonutricia]|uniref:Extracellular solute-binding protein family 1 n=1 Tax=Leadbettera azotonutricia (strain ATCC BAA-888 / DSM 13862 / ZAS-9) TaxID=545695 RepID=F5YA37_LEAAZ|nr:ABC transporter substrate-binding protein [Leadbettera azotonutricia]AEF82697.1 extracellular solute-binding protein family 1 [Leadbettera azotonutricia ZAS-9]